MPNEIRLPCLLVGVLVSSAESKHEQTNDGAGVNDPKDQLLQRSHLLLRTPQP